MNAPRSAPSAAATGVSSPCINVCRMNDRTGLCEGCWRTLDEIALWSQLDDDTKREVWRLIELRKSAP